MTSFLPDVLVALYGPGWSTGQVAERLDVNPRRVRAWATGEEPVPEGVWRELYEMLVEQAHENARLSSLIMREIYPDEEHI